MPDGSSTTSAAVPEPDDTAAGPLRPSAVYFQTDDLRQNLGRRTARGGAYTLASTGVNFVVTTVATVLVTRHLTQEDFGLYGMVLVLTGFAGMFVDLGLSRAVVQKPNISHEQVSTLFWINLGVASLLALTVAAATPLLVWFYDEPRLTPINLAMSSLFIVGALGLQHRALLERRMEFGQLNLIAVTVPIIASTVAVALALLDAGYWALVALPATSQFLAVAGMWLMCRWIPGPPRRGSGVRTMLAFGGHVTGFQFVNYFARNADNAMLGYAWGAGPLGLYTRAYSLMMLPTSKINVPLSGVVVPTLSRLVDTPVQYRRFYCRAIRSITYINSVIILTLVLLSPELLPVLLGSEWGDVVPVFLLLSPAVLVATNNMAPGWLYMSIGHVHRQLRWAVMVIPIQIAAMAAGVQFGAEGMALAVGLLYPIIWIPYVAYAARGTPVQLRDYLSAACVPQSAAVIALVAGGTIAIVFAEVLLEGRLNFGNFWRATTLDGWALWAVVFVKLVSFLTVICLFTVISSTLSSDVREMGLLIRGKIDNPPQDR